MNNKNCQSVLAKVRQSVLSGWAPNKWKNTKIVAAVSGGPDSVAMLRVLHSLVGEFSSSTHLVVAHVNHKTRAADSDRDQNFVEQLAAQFQLEFETEGIAPAAAENHSESNLRKLRYEILAKIAQRIGARYIATGHNLDDQVETILFRIFRGTGISGLAGIPSFRDLGSGITVVRPFHHVPRETIKDLLDELDQDYQLDKSNLDSKFAQNFIRNELLPLVRNRLGEHIDESILRLGAQSREYLQFLDLCCADLTAAIQRADNSLIVDCTKLDQQPEVLVTHLLMRTWKDEKLPQQAMKQAHWRQLTRLILGDLKSNVVNLPANIRAERTND